MRNNEDRFGTQQELHDASPVQQIMQRELEANKTLSPSSIEFITPIEIVELPSGGKFYAKNHPLHNKTYIEIKQMTAKEEDILTSRSLLKKGVALDKLIQSLMVNKEINPDLLTIEDRNAIIVNARIAAYGRDYETTITCPSCSSKVKYKFDLLEKNETEEEQSVIETDENGLFSITLPATKWNIVCRSLNGNDEKNLLKLSESKKNSANDSILLDQLKMMVVSIQGVADRSIVEKALSALPASDSRYLRKEYQKSVKPFDLKKNFSCKSCEYEAVLEVPLTADFFWFK